MSTPSSFTSSSIPGRGRITARLLPPARLVLPVLSFSYPLKLISSSLPSSKCLTVFLLSYGGGLVSNDRIDLSVNVEPGAKLCLLTQGSTKIFKRKAPEHVTRQNLDITLTRNASLLLLPDPLQPFARSSYTQTQRFYLPADDSASIVMLDWASEGRSAVGEHWDLDVFSSKNEFFVSQATASTSVSEVPSSPRLMLRDALYLSRSCSNDDYGELRRRMEDMAVFATLVVHGPKFSRLSEHILARYTKEPRVGGKRWDDGPDGGTEKRQFEGVMWTAANRRGFTVLKASGRDLEQVRAFLKDVVLEGKGIRQEDGDGKSDGDVVREFGEGAVMCLH